MIKKLIITICSYFQSYRQKKGGVWYHIKEKDVSGFAAPSDYWSQELPKDRDCEIIKIEYYR